MQLTTKQTKSISGKQKANRWLGFDGGGSWGANFWREDSLFDWLCIVGVEEAAPRIGELRRKKRGGESGHNCRGHSSSLWAENLGLLFRDQRVRLFAWKKINVLFCLLFGRSSGIRNLTWDGAYWYRNFGRYLICFS